MEPRDPAQDGSPPEPEYLAPSGASQSVTGTLAEATRRVLRRRFRVFLLIRDAYEHMIAHEDVLGAVWEDLRTSLRLLLAWADRSYRQVPWASVALLVAALVYFVTPVDVIPDALGALGFVDDVAVISSAVETVRTELNRFRNWEETSPKALSS